MERIGKYGRGDDEVIARCVVVMTLAGMIIAGFGERMWLLLSWQEKRDISSVAVAVTQALVSPASADAAVTKKNTAKGSSRLILVPSKSKVKKKTASATGQLKSKRTKKGGRSVAAVNLSVIRKICEDLRSIVWYSLRLLMR